MKNSSIILKISSQREILVYGNDELLKDQDKDPLLAYKKVCRYFSSQTISYVKECDYQTIYEIFRDLPTYGKISYNHFGEEQFENDSFPGDLTPWDVRRKLLQAAFLGGDPNIPLVEKILASDFMKEISSSQVFWEDINYLVNVKSPAPKLYAKLAASENIRSLGSFDITFFMRSSNPRWLCDLLIENYPPEVLFQDLLRVKVSLGALEYLLGKNYEAVLFHPLLLEKYFEVAYLDFFLTKGTYLPSYLEYLLLKELRAYKGEFKKKYEIVKRIIPSFKFLDSLGIFIQLLRDEHMGYALTFWEVGALEGDLGLALTHLGIRASRSYPPYSLARDLKVLIRGLLDRGADPKGALEVLRFPSEGRDYLLEEIEKR